MGIGAHVDAGDDRIVRSLADGRRLFVLTAGVCVPARVLLGAMLGMRYRSDAVVDDTMLMAYAQPEHWLSDDYLSMAKRPGYGLFLMLVHASGLPLALVMSLLWVAGAFTAWRAIRVLTGRSGPAVFAFLATLWCPLAFEESLGVRVYRNSLMPPLLVLMLCAMLLSVVCRRMAARLPWGVLGGFLFGCCWLLKEDSVWLLPLGCAWIVASAWTSVRRRDWTRRILGLVIALACAVVPVVMVGATLAANERAFGVRMLDTRTEGELAGFVQRVYLIDVPDRSLILWTPDSALEKAVAVSPSLRADGRLVDGIMHGGYRGREYGGQLREEQLTWQLRLAVQQATGWPGERRVQTMFHAINRELDAAFADGRLERARGLRITGSIPPIPVSVLPGIIERSVWTWTRGVVMDQWRPAGPRPDTDNPRIEQDQARGLETMNTRPSQPHGVTVSRMIAVVWSVVMTAALIVGIIRALTGLLRSGRRRLVLLALLLMGYALAYATAVSWFTIFVGDPEGVFDRYWDFYYGSGCVTPFLLTAIPLTFGGSRGSRFHCSQSVFPRPPHGIFGGRSRYRSRL